MWRIFYLITDLDIGGAEKSLYQLVTRLDKKKFSVTVVSLSCEGAVSKKLKTEGIDVVSLNARSKIDVLVFFKLVKQICLKDPHVLHTYLFHANFLGRIAGWLCKVPIIVSSVRVAEEQKRHHLYLDMFTQWMIDKEVCVSKEVEIFMRKRAKISASKLLTIHNGIDISDFNRLAEKDINSKRKKLSISEFSPVIGTVARLTPQKGLSYLIKAFHHVLMDFHNCCLLVVGKGPQRIELETLSQKLGVISNVKFLGFRKDVKEIIDLMDVFVLPSLWEGMPNVVLEAYALSKPVVATSVGGAVEIIKDKETGFLVSPKDCNGLAEHIKILLSNPKMRKTFGKRGKEFITENFSLNRVVENTEKLYCELINQKL